MKRFIICTCISVLLSSCFEIIEEVNLNEDGSGHFKYTMNFSQSASKIQSLLQEDEVEGYKVPTLQAIEKEFERHVNKSQSIKGITAVSHSFDQSAFIFVYECDFTKIELLNKFTDSLRSMHDDDYNPSTYFAFNPTQKTFTRTGDDLIEKLNQKMTSSQRLIFNGATYTCLYRFFNEISEKKPTGINVSVNKRNTFHRLSMSAMIWNGKLIDQEIKLK